MNSYFADLHIHIGRTSSGRPVKITGSKTLTLRNILKAASERKGLDLIGIIDCHSPEVIAEIEEMTCNGELTEVEGGGLQYGKTTLIPGSEIEIYDANCHGPIHVLAYFPSMEAMKQFSGWMSGHLKNIHLSSQRVYADGKTLQKTVKDMGGLFIPAHVFTPFKSLYGKGVKHSLREVFDEVLIDGVELGLSSDTDMAQGIPELSQYVFLTNSDAHSLGKLAREYQKFELERPSFHELKLALGEESGRRVSANYGLNPELGKYHGTVCGKCFTSVKQDVKTCPVCGSRTIIKGVSKRIEELSQPLESFKQRKRPPYIRQVPLDFIPGVGPRTMEKLLHAFGTEMNILHSTDYDSLKLVVPEKVAGYIDLARQGKLNFNAGGGGKYGKIIPS
ncbi:endonuclease Q family protein [Bacillus sp. MUM 13]|uniref:endonuclease Q family protein n=1 Tax=Bacillus sp. MUM 13 TaxID=1678001 RepID=UPI0008F5E24C|nr:endonuclease Q family protein [Bacillus sp. MUM 13]OIK13639.1 hypothetical protein BIV59_05340 [Bacillus sp. MUM 13]